VDKNGGKPGYANFGTQHRGLGARRARQHADDAVLTTFNPGTTIVSTDYDFVGDERDRASRPRR
jgi:hypothetical protein